ncbi:hypothetical protein MNBD_GAMMA08-739 [hydrothermal vent metagenome]|uniref:Uncharacterized protein n=1 Tax=hydrothermal vent metagenome TaxID=652676 RepID=A0A3B0XBY8_9ZZZZ
MKVLTRTISLTMLLFLPFTTFADVQSNQAATADTTSSASSGPQQQGQLGVGGNEGTGNGIGNNNSRTSYEARDIPVATAYAPALTTSNDTCMGSTSAGAQGLLLGISFGTTWTDDDCITRKDARFVHNAGHRIVALSLMCGKEAVRAAVARAGTPEQKAACAITEAEIKEYREIPVIVQVDRTAPDFDDDNDHGFDHDHDFDDFDHDHDFDDF